MHSNDEGETTAQQMQTTAKLYSLPQTSAMEPSVQQTYFGEVLQGLCGTLLPPGLLGEVEEDMRQLSSSKSFN